jgi:hypothetical protein
MQSQIQLGQTSSARAVARARSRARPQCKNGPLLQMGRAPMRGNINESAPTPSPLPLRVRISQCTKIYTRCMYGEDRTRVTHKCIWRHDGHYVLDFIAHSLSALFLSTSDDKMHLKSWKCLDPNAFIIWKLIALGMGWNYLWAPLTNIKGQCSWCQ